MSEELLEQIDEGLKYGDSRSQWVRDAIEMKLEILEELDDLERDMSDQERREFVLEAVREAVKRE